MSQPAVATTRPSRTRASPTAQADALEEFAVSKSIAVKSKGTPPPSLRRVPPARRRAATGALRARRTGERAPGTTTGSDPAAVAPRPGV